MGLIALCIVCLLLAHLAGVLARALQEVADAFEELARPDPFVDGDPEPEAGPELRLLAGGADPTGRDAA